MASHVQSHTNTFPPSLTSRSSPLPHSLTIRSAVAAIHNPFHPQPQSTASTPLQLQADQKHTTAHPPNLTCLGTIAHMSLINYRHGIAASRRDIPSASEPTGKNYYRQPRAHPRHRHPTAKSVPPPGDQFSTNRDEKASN